MCVCVCSCCVCRVPSSVQCSTPDTASLSSGYVSESVSYQSVAASSDVQEMDDDDDRSLASSMVSGSTMASASSTTSSITAESTSHCNHGRLIYYGRAELRTSDHR